MRKFKLDKKTSLKITALFSAGTIAVTSFVGCVPNNNNNNNNTAIVQMYTQTNDSIQKLFPTLNQNKVHNSAIIILLSDIVKEDENGKVTAENISMLKSNLDVDKMMDDFNDYLNALEQYMINNKVVLATSNYAATNDKEILSKVSKITSNIMNGTEEEVKENFKLIYTLFVEENKVTYDGLTFEIRDLSYSGRALASAYARTVAAVNPYITKEEYNKIDERTNNQNNKAYIKTQLEIVDNLMEEKSQLDIVNIFNNEYLETKNEFANKINVSDENIKNLVNYINLEYLDSDKVSTKDKNTILGEYSEENITNTLLTIDAITEYNQNNKDNIILLSNLNNANQTLSETDKLVLDLVQASSIQFLNSTTEEDTKNRLYNSLYFENMYNCFYGKDFDVYYQDGTIKHVNNKNISEGTRFVINEIILYTLNKRPKIYEYNGIKEKLNSNLTNSVQYIQNTITGECKKSDMQFVK